MKKYLVDVYLPTAGLHLDAFLPANKSIGDVLYLLSIMGKNVSNGTYQPTSSSMLLDAENGQELDNQKTVEEAGIRNASRLILI